MSWPFHYSFSWGIYRKQADHLFCVYTGEKTEKEPLTERRKVLVSDLFVWGVSEDGTVGLGEYLNT